MRCAPSAARSMPSRVERGAIGQRRCRRSIPSSALPRGAVPVDRRARGSRDRPWCFRRISDSAAASSRKSISIAHRARQRLDDLDEAQPARLGGRSARRCRAAKRHVREVAREAPFDAGAQHLHRDVALAVRRSHAGPMDLRDRGGRDRRRRTRRKARPRACRARPRSCATASRAAGTAPCGPAAARDRARPRTPTMSGRVARNWPSLT